MMKPDDQVLDAVENLRPSVIASAERVLLPSGATVDVYDYIREQVWQARQRRVYRGDLHDMTDAGFRAYKAMLDGFLAYSIDTDEAIIEAIAKDSIGPIVRAIADCAVEYVLDVGDDA